MTEYLLLSRAFRVGKGVSGNYAGLVVAGRDAFYFVVGPKATHMGMEAGGGVLGALVAAWLKRRSGGTVVAGAPSGVSQMDLSELPAEVTTLRDWPVRQKEGPVLVITREAISSIRYSFWQWGIFLEVETLEFRIEPPFFGREKKLRWLEEAGWPLERTEKKA